MGRTGKKWLVAWLFLAWLAWELIAAFDPDPHTWPLTRIVTTYLPPWIYFPGVVIFAGWLVFHFRPRRRAPAHKEATMGFKFEPVKWMTWLLGLLTALSGVSLFMDWLPERVQAGVLVAIAVLTAVLGALARDRVTPLARPRDNAGRPLVPVPGTAGTRPVRDLP